MRLVKKIGLVLVSVLITLLILFNLYNLFCLKVLNQDLATFGGYAILEVVSGSMEPTIHVGDLVIIQTKAKDYQANDIITFYDEDGSFVTHRILSINENEMITKGDNNNSEDTPTSTDKIVGKYVLKLTGVGMLLNAFKSPVVLVLILFIGILICFLVSTDQEGKPLLNEEEAEFQAFLEKKNGDKKFEKMDSFLEKFTLKKANRNISEKKDKQNSTSSTKITNKNTKMKSNSGSRKTSSVSTNSKKRVNRKN